MVTLSNILEGKIKLDEKINFLFKRLRKNITPFWVKNEIRTVMSQQAPAN